jgi:hypothetical protein
MQFFFKNHLIFIWNENNLWKAWGIKKNNIDSKVFTKARNFSMLEYNITNYIK